MLDTCKFYMTEDIMLGPVREIKRFNNSRLEFKGVFSSACFQEP